MLWIILGILISYSIGSIPTAYIFGRFIKGIDIRKFGSGNVGATNALRVLGKGTGITVLLLDILKGVVVVVLLGDFLISKLYGFSDEILRVILGINTVSGHNWSIFLRFKGGKGVATTLGVLLGLAVKINGLKIVFALVILTWLVVFMMARIVSVASVLTGVSLPIYIWLFKQSYVLILSSIILSIFIVLRHRSNLKRIFRGEEKRLF